MKLKNTLKAKGAQDPLAALILAGGGYDDSRVKVPAGKQGLTFNGRAPQTADKREPETV